MLDARPPWPRVLLLAALLIGGCGGAERHELEPLDLVELFQHARVRQESAAFEASQSPALDPLVEGRRSREGSYRSAGPLLRLEFFSADRQDLHLDAECRSLQTKQAELDVRLNRKSIGRISVGKRPSTSTVRMPVEAVESGVNELEFLLRQPTSAPFPGSGRLPELFECEALHIGGLGPNGRPRADSQASVILLPFGTQAEFFVSLADEAVLEMGHLRALRPGEAPGRLELVLEEVATGEARAIQWEPTERPSAFTWDLPIRDPGEYRLVLRPLSSDGQRDTGGLRLVSPIVRPGRSPDQERMAIRSPVQPPAPVNVVLYVIDTLRADHLGCYGYHRPTSPNLDAFSKDSVLFENAIATSSWTRPSIASILTGLSPQVHGANGKEDSIAEGVVTLAEMLKPAGHRSFGFVTNGNVHGRWGFSAGFERYRFMGYPESDSEAPRSSVEVNRSVAKWLSNGVPTPFFLLLHVVDPHAPYEAEEPWRRLFAPAVADPGIGQAATLNLMNTGRAAVPSTIRQDLVDLYDAEIAANDHSFGQLVAMLQDAGLYDSSLIVVVSDHGEEFQEHGRWSHGLTLYQEQLRVPLLIKWPGGTGAGLRVTKTVSLVDLVPTILEVSGAPLPTLPDGRGFDGESLVPFLSGRGRERASYSYLAKGRREMRSVVLGPWKLVHNLGNDRYVPPLELYTLDTDPGERRSASSERRGLRDYLLEVLELGWLRPSFTRRSIEEPIDADLRKNLEALGYL